MAPTAGHHGCMDIGDALDVVRTQHRAVLATFRPDGTPQMTPVTVGVDDDDRIEISTRQTAYKVRNIRRDPRVYLCVLPDGFFGRWIQVDGRADLLELPAAMEPLVAYYRRISGEHPDWEDYRAAMIRDQRLIIRVEILRVGPDREG
jgi:PPOX class probable F420-dependent enzyme